LKIIVFIESVPDTTVALEGVEEVGRLNEDWNVRVLNPDDGAALAAALKIAKEIAGTRVVAVHLGPPSGDRFLRDALALGCDEGLRVWDEGLEDIHTEGKVLIFARIAKISGFDLIFTGTGGMNGGGQLAVLLAAALRVPWVTRVLAVDAAGDDKITAVRRLERGFQEQVESSRPLVVAMEAEEEADSYASFPAVVAASEAALPCFDLARIGIPLETIRLAESRLIFGPLRFPEPRLEFIQAPDSSLPAFDRRLRLGEGSTAARQGRIVRGEMDAVAEELFETLRRQGWLEHLKRENEKT
jgi:electron transfer flavoprotein beta subunit